MGKRIIQQARGRGSSTYRVRRKAFKYKLKYPRKLQGQGQIIKLLNSLAHSSPIAKIRYGGGVFYIPAFEGMIEGQKIDFGEREKGGEGKEKSREIKPGDILELKNIPLKTSIYNIESRPGDGGVFVKTAGSSANLNRVVGKDIFVLMPSKKEKKFNLKCRAIIGMIAGSGRLEKPFVKAGKKYYLMKSKSKLWPRTSAVKMNIVDHPFGSGRGKNPKSKVAKRNAPPGKKVGLLRPRRTGRRKR